MLLPLLPSLEHHAGDLPRQLVSEVALGRLLDTARVLSLHASTLALECRLSADDRVDLLLATPAEPAHQTALLRDAERLSCRDPAWGRIASFCAEWSSSDSLLAANVPVLWLELDLPTGGQDIPPPLPFLCVDPRVHAVPGRRAGGTMEALGRAFALLEAAPLGVPLEAITRCIQNLPPGGRLLHVAPLTARGSDAVRLVISLERRALRGFLSSVGAVHDLSGIEAIATLVEPCSSTITLHLDAPLGPSPTLSVEVYFPPGSAQLPRLLSALVARGAVLPEKAAALPSWPFEGRISFPGRSWPVRLLRAVQIKLTTGPDNPLLAKAYLGCSHSIALF